MRRFMILVLGLAVVLMCQTLLPGSATAQLLDSHLPPKSDDHVLQDPFDGERQGGDTIGSSVPIPMLPYAAGGTTCGYEDDYDAACPYEGSTSPDVVYRYIVEDDMFMTVDLCGSEYNTKVYILNNTLDVLACNDDFYFGGNCGLYVSKISNAFIAGGQIIYIVIDGFGGECGEYLINVNAGVPQGGDTIATATPIPALPYSTIGATCQFNHDYDAICPYSGSTSPDAVYSLNVVDDTSLTIDLCGSSYDTKVYVLDAGLNVLACNDDYYFDDFCGVYVSKIEDAFIAGGQTVYIVIDGYGGDCGDYVMDVNAGIFVPCAIECPGGGVQEGEPPLVDGYEDYWNGGCNSPQFGTPFQDLFSTGGNHIDLCGVGGWYLLNGNNYRDTDWFIAVLDSDGAGFIDCTIDAEQGTYLFELFPQDCENVAVAQLVQVIGGCNPQAMVVFGAPGDIVWLWVGADIFAPPPGFVGNEYDYLLTVDGIEDGVIATENASWSEVKSLYR